MKTLQIGERRCIDDHEAAQVGIVAVTDAHGARLDDANGPLIFRKWLQIGPMGLSQFVPQVAYSVSVKANAQIKHNPSFLSQSRDDLDTWVVCKQQNFDNINYIQTLSNR
jgi:hypothetical protein